MTGSLRMKFLLACAAPSVFLFACHQMAFAKALDKCELPSGLKSEISKKYPGTRVVTQADLNPDDSTLFRKDHGDECPGLARVNFYGDGKPTRAIILITAGISHATTGLIVAHKIGTEWQIETLEAFAEVGSAVIWNQGPGTYDDLWEPKSIHAKNPVIVFCGYNSRARLYAWTGKKVEFVQLRD
jgi:hypothetical protein